jgi:hypothetical protein
MTTNSTRPPTRLGHIAAVGEGLAVVVGLPALLVGAVGWPLPHSVPQWSEVHTAYQLRYIPDRLVIGALACAGWICWVLLVWSLLSATAARHRAIEHRRPMLMPGVGRRCADNGSCCSQHSGS